MPANRTLSDTTTTESPWPRVAFFGLVATLVATLILLPSGVLTRDTGPLPPNLDLALRTVAAPGDREQRGIVSPRSGLAQDAALAATRHGGHLVWDHEGQARCDHGVRLRDLAVRPSSVPVSTSDEHQTSTQRRTTCPTATR